MRSEALYSSIPAVQAEPLFVENATLLGYSQNTEYFGSDIGFKRTVEISVSCSSSNITNQKGVSPEAADFFKLVEAKKDYANLSINGVSFGNAKITSFSTEPSDMVNSLTCSISFLIHQSFDDLSSLTGYYSDYQAAEMDGSILDSFSDSVDLSRAENSQSYARSIQIQANKSQNIDDVSGLIRNYITSILNYGTFSFPDLTAFEEDINDLTNSSFKKFVTETVDEASLTFSFQENLSSGNVAGDYSIVVTQNYSIDSSGIAQVTESGEIIGLTNPRIDAAEAGYAAEYSNATSRIKDFFDEYRCLGTPDLNESSGVLIFSSKSKVIDQFRGVITYTLNTNNDPKYKDGNGEVWDSTINVNFDGKHITATEQGNVTGAGTEFYDGDAVGGNLNLYPKYLSAKSHFINYVLPGGSGVDPIRDRIVAYITGTPCQNPVTRSETHSPRKGQISYSRSYSNNPIYALNDGISKKIELDSTLSDSVKNKSKFVSLNPENSREIVQELSTSSPIQASNSLTIIGYRIDPTQEASKMVDFGELAASKLELFSLSTVIKYLASCSFEFSGANNVVFKLSTSHLGGVDSCQ